MLTTRDDISITRLETLLRQLYPLQVEDYRGLQSLTEAFSKSPYTAQWRIVALSQFLVNKYPEIVQLLEGVPTLNFIIDKYALVGVKLRPPTERQPILLIWYRPVKSAGTETLTTPVARLVYYLGMEGRDMLINEIMKNLKSLLGESLLNLLDFELTKLGYEITPSKRELILENLPVLLDILEKNYNVSREVLRKVESTVRNVVQKYLVEKAKKVQEMLKELKETSKLLQHYF